MTTRRQLVVAGAGALAVALARPPAASALAGEARAVNALVLAEDAAAAAYEIAAGATGDGLLARIAAQDVQHAHALRVMHEALTVPPPHHRPHAERREPAAIRLAQARALSSALDAALALEARLQQVYVDAAGALVSAGVLRTVATVLGSHAQQAAVLRAAAGLAPLGPPFVARA
jgi:hypothetical protein